MKVIIRNKLALNHKKTKSLLQFTSPNQPQLSICYLLETMQLNTIRQKGRRSANLVNPYFT